MTTQRNRKHAIHLGLQGYLAFAGQSCELPDDVAFTIDYSIHSAQTAVCKGKFDPKVL